MAGFNSTVSNGTGPFTYLWTFGDGHTATTENASHIYATTGTYPVTYVATDSVGQQAKQNATVTVNNTPSVTGSATPSPSEVGVAVGFTATVSGGSPPVSIAWVFGDGSQGTGATTSHTYATAGTFTAMVWANDSFGASDHNTVSVTVDPRLAVTASSTPTATDVGATVTFSAVSSGGVSPTFAWEFGDGTSGSGTGPTHVYAAEGTYTAKVWANDTLGVSVEATTTVTVVADPTLVGFSVAPASVTTGASIVFSASVSGGTGPFSFVYSGLPAGCATVNQSSLTCSPSATGTYTVHLALTDAVGKTANASVTLSVTSPSSSTFLGLPATEGYLLLAAAIVIIAALILWVVIRRRRGSSGQSSPSPTSGGGTPSESPAGQATPASSPASSNGEK
jgi:large repetitive protein